MVGKSRSVAVGLAAPCACVLLQLQPLLILPLVQLLFWCNSKRCPVGRCWCYRGLDFQRNRQSGVS